MDIQKGNLQKLHDVNWCTNKIENVLLHKRTLLVLDGIDNFEQLDVLIGTKRFHPRSKIIITTIDGSLTEKSGLFGKNISLKHMKHLLEGLDETESLQLLCLHAFKCNDPKERYQELSRKVVKHCGGHPLALKVIGSSLRNDDVVAWEDAIEFLEKEPNPDIQKFLQISYDSLRSENEKELFKHIACFFVGKDREFTEMILKECGIKTTSGFSKLIDTCLVTVGPRNELMMHQLLQGMGRDLVRHESPKKPWKRSRLWHHDESYDVLKQDKGTNKIQGLVLSKKVVEDDTLGGTNTSTKELPRIHWLCNFFSKIWCLFVWVFLLCFSHHDKVDLRTIALSKMDKLRLLQLNYVQLHGSYKHFPKGLRWLSMHGFPLSYIPFDLQMEKMVALDMSYSNLQQLWKKPKLLPSLKILNLSFSKIVRIGDFSWLPALERLILTRCVSLVKVCESIELCNKLVLLDVSYCIKLKRLPRSTRRLKNIRILLVGGCTNLCEYPRHMKDMKSLEVLNAREFIINSQSSPYAIVDVIQKGLKGFSLFNSLVRISLKNNNLSNELFPMDFSSLTKLKVLNLSWNPLTSLNVRNLSRLEVLCLEGCHYLKYVSCISMIAYMNIHNCSSLEKLEYEPVTKPNISSLSSVSVVEIESMRKVQPLAQVNENIIRNLGWKDLVNVKNQNVHIIDGIRWDTPQKLQVQMLYELGIFSILFKQRAIPEWFSQRSKGSSITFIVPSSPYNLRGLNVGYVYTYSQYGEWVDLIRNKTKNLHQKYCPNLQVVRVDDDEESIVCIRHWVISNNEIEEGDEVTVDIALTMGNG
uniref:NB-ARC domain-containing protein n=2 Tax=Lactuca sativa TaxID=4236 RepID=A0A9R1V499_LACSA|nr:hypothetical protein LSAT_V11C700364920 [Lactuca sativa]